MSPEDVTREFEEAGALLRGHFLLSSGRHSDTYFQAARVLEDPARGGRLGAALAAALGGREVEVVVSPAIGGILAGYEVARGLGVPFLFAEKTAAGGFELRRGFALGPGTRVAVVEDVLTTGGSASRAAAMVAEHGAEVVAVAALVDRGPGGAPLPVESTVLWRPRIRSWEPDACELCASGAAPAIKPGSRAPGA